MARSRREAPGGGPTPIIVVAQSPSPIWIVMC